MDYKLNLITPSLYSPDGDLNCKDDVVEEFAEYVKKRAQNELNLLCKYDKIPGRAFISNFEDFENRFLIHSEYAVIIASPFSQKALNKFIPRLLVFLTSKPIWQNRCLFVFLGDVKIISNLFTNDPIQFSTNKWDEQDEESWKTLLNLVKISWKPQFMDEQLSGSLNPCDDEPTSRKVNPIKKDLSLRPQVEITDIEIKSELLESTYCGKSFISLEENEKMKEVKSNLCLDIMTSDNHGNDSDDNSDCSSEQTYICQPNIPNSPIPVIILEEDTFTKPDGVIDHNKDEQNINANIMIKNQSSLTQQVQESIVHKATINFERQSISDMSTCKILSEGLNSQIILKGSNIDNNDSHFKSGRHKILKYELQEENHEDPYSIRVENEEKVIIKSNFEKNESEVPREDMNKKEIENQSEILLLTDTRKVEYSLNPQTIFSNKKIKNPNGHEEISEKKLLDSNECEFDVSLFKFEEKREVEHSEEAVAKSKSHKVPFSIRTQSEGKVEIKPNSQKNESVIITEKVFNTNRKELENQNAGGVQLLTDIRKTDLINPQTIHLSKKVKNLKEHKEIIEKQRLDSDECGLQISLIKGEEKGQVEKSEEAAFVAKSESHKVPFSFRTQNEGKVELKPNSEKNNSVMVTENVVNTNRKELENQNAGGIQLLTDIRKEDLINPQTIHLSKKVKNLKEHEEIIEKEYLDSDECGLQISLIKGEEKGQVEKSEVATFFAKSESHKVPFNFPTQNERKVEIKPNSEKIESVIVIENVANKNKKEIENQNGGGVQLLTDIRKTDLINPQTIHLSKKGKNLKEHKEIIEKQHLDSDECEPQISLIKGEEKGQVEKSEEAAFIAKNESHKVPFSFRTQSEGKVEIKPSSQKNESVIITEKVFNTNRKELENQNAGGVQLLTDIRKTDLINPQTIHLSKKVKNLKEHEEIIEKRHLDSDECEPQIPLIKGEEKRDDIERSKRAISFADNENTFENTIIEKVKVQDDISSDNSCKKSDKQSQFNKSRISQLSHKENSTVFEVNNKSQGVLLPNQSDFQESVHVITTGNEYSNRIISKTKPNQLNRSDENRKINEFKDGDKCSESSKRESTEKVIDYKKGDERIFSATNNDNIQQKNTKEQSDKNKIISDKMGSTKTDVSIGNENTVDSEMANRAFKNGNGIKDSSSNKNTFREEHISKKNYSVETNKLKTSDENNKDIDSILEIKENINKKSIIYESDHILKHRVNTENVHDNDDESSDVDNLIIENNMLEINSSVECINVKKEKMTLSMQMFNDDSQSCQEDLTIKTNSRTTNETFSFGISSLLAKIGSFSHYFWRTPDVDNSQLLIKKDKSPASRFWFFKHLQSPWCVFLLFATGTLMSPYWISLTRLKVIDNCIPIIMAEPTTPVLNEESVYKKYRYMLMRRGPTANFRIIAPHN